MSEHKEYYDGTKLLSLMDINGNKPEIYICTSNRSAGKTTYFGRLCVKKWQETGEKFCLIYRYSYELEDCPDKFFKDISHLFFNDKVMTAKMVGKGIFAELFIDNKSCGYAVALNKADQIKKHSHLLSDVKRMIFDEFQSETNSYCSKEVEKFISIHTSIARGNGELVRYVPVYMISNPISIINPYYTELGISNRIKDETKFLKGDGFVLEQGYVESASEAQKNSAFNRAFSNNEYVAYSSEAVYLNDNDSFIEKVDGNSKYLATIKCDGRCYAIREYADKGIIYCDEKADETFWFKITTTTEDHGLNYVMLKRSSSFISLMREYFEKGCFRFKTLKCKEVVLKTLSYV